VDEAKENIRKIKNSLKNILVKTRQVTEKIVKKILQKIILKTKYLKSGFDIAVIGAVGFYYNLKNADNELFSTSLYEIDRIINKRRYFIISIEKELAYVPNIYKDFIDVFSKIESDKLPPHRSYDYKITLENNNTLKYSPPYRISIKELEILKQYFLDNLKKDFIEPN
jgi:hypothetical protein